METSRIQETLDQTKHRHLESPRTMPLLRTPPFPNGGLCNMEQSTPLHHYHELDNSNGRLNGSFGIYRVCQKTSFTGNWIDALSICLSRSATDYLLTLVFKMLHKPTYRIYQLRGSLLSKRRLFAIIKVQLHGFKPKRHQLQPRMSNYSQRNIDYHQLLINVFHRKNTATANNYWIVTKGYHSWLFLEWNGCITELAQA